MHFRHGLEKFNRLRGDRPIVMRMRLKQRGAVWTTVLCKTERQATKILQCFADFFDTSTQNTKKLFNLTAVRGNNLQKSPKRTCHAWQNKACAKTGVAKSAFKHTVV